ncbi:MAG: ribosome biogenesis factor YjgA [Endozoicomonas sp.]
MSKKSRRLQESWEDDEDVEEVIYVSKSELKRDMNEMKAVGERLMALKPAQLDKLPLNDRLRAALDESKRITSHNARKRHLGFIGKLLVDQEMEPVMEFLNQLDSSSEEYNRRFHQLERWRDRLVGDADSNKALTDYLEQYPEADHQHIRQLVRNAQKEASQNKPPTAARKLFKYLRAVEEL